MSVYIHVMCECGSLPSKMRGVCMLNDLIMVHSESMLNNLNFCRRTTPHIPFLGSGTGFILMQANLDRALPIYNDSPAEFLESFKKFLKKHLGSWWPWQCAGGTAWGSCKSPHRWQPLQDILFFYKHPCVCKSREVVTTPTWLLTYYYLNIVLISPVMDKNKHSCCFQAWCLTRSSNSASLWYRQQWRAICSH